QWVELPADVARNEPGEASRGERRIGARDDAGPRGWIDVPELRGQREDPPVACYLLAPKGRMVVPISNANAIVDGRAADRPQRRLGPFRRRPRQLRHQPA